jgi:hypothetical protein
MVQILQLLAQFAVGAARYPLAVFALQQSLSQVFTSLPIAGTCCRSTRPSNPIVHQACEPAPLALRSAVGAAAAPIGIRRSW